LMMLSGAEDERSLRDSLAPILESQGMCLHVDPIEGGLHKHVIPNVHVTVSGADRPGIVSQVTAVLAELGLNILDLESDVAGAEDKPIYIMQITAVSTLDIESIESALSAVRESGVSVSVSAIETYIG
jgi:glycine cleavage system transcriptional repressor